MKKINAFLIFLFLTFSSLTFATPQPNWASYGTRVTASECPNIALTSNVCPAGEIKRILNYQSNTGVTPGTGAACNFTTANVQCAANPCTGGDTWQLVPALGQGMGACGPPSCPTGKVLNIVINGADATISCVVEGSAGNGTSSESASSVASCPSGYPKFNGSCQVCFQYNPDGSCVSPTQCPSGQVNQGTINGQAVCQKTCPDKNQSFGVVNGVEGCYGSPTCPDPSQSFGSVNGVYGCYGGNGSGSGSSTSSGSGSGTSTGSGTGTSSGSGTSSGTGSGSGGGGGGTNNNSVGVPYTSNQTCPAGFIKDGSFCVTSRGDCIEGYHSVVVSNTPFYAMCVQNNSSSLASSASFSVSSSPTNNSSIAASSVNGSSGSGTSSGSGSGSGTSSGSGSGSGTSSGSGQCDPTAKSYDECMGRNKTPSDSETKAITDSNDQNVKKLLDDYEKTNNDSINDLKQNGVPFAGAVNSVKTILLAFFPQYQQCQPYTMTFRIIGTITLSCKLFDMFKLLFGWFLSISTAIYIYHLAIRPIER